MLTDAQIADYHERGYVVPDYRLSTDTLEAIKEEHTRLLRDNPDHPEFHDNCPDLLTFDLGFLNYARNKDIIDMAAQLIGPDIALWNMSFFAKPAHDGKKTPWHQDGAYWPIRPLATCSVWVAIDAATSENGCLRFIPGSHKSQRMARHEHKEDPNFTLFQELHESEFDEKDAVSLILEPGQISLHDVYIYHGSESNSSDRSRRGMTMRLMPTTSHYDRDVARQIHERNGAYDQSIRTLFLMRGTDRCGKNDYGMQLTQ